MRKQTSPIVGQKTRLEVEGNSFEKKRVTVSRTDGIIEMLSRIKQSESLIYRGTSRD